MAGRRQQRTQNNRGQQLTVARRYVPDILWQLTAVEGNAILITPSSPPSDLFIKGVASFAVEGTAIVATSTDFVLDDIRVVLSADPDPDFVLTLPSLDDHIRSANGAYLAGGHFAWTDPTQAPPIVTASGTFGTYFPNIVYYPNNDVAENELQGGSDYAWVVVTNPGFAIGNQHVTAGGDSWDVTPGSAGVFERNAGTWTRTS